MNTSATIGSTTAVTSSAHKYGRAFWERLWGLSGIGAFAFFALAYFISGHQPAVGATGNALFAFYDGERTRILVASILSGMGMLNLMWFASALRNTLVEAGQEGWGASVTASSATFGALFLLFIAAGTTLAYSIAGAGSQTLTSGLNCFSWSCVVLSSFPRAMLIMAPTFGFWRAGYISNRLFAVGVVALMLVLLGGTTWLRDGFWAPDGAYSRIISPSICMAWIVVLTQVLLTRSPRARAGW